LALFRVRRFITGGDRVSFAPLRVRKEILYKTPCMPVSRQRKIQKARKRTRVPHSTETPQPLTNTAAGNTRYLRIGAVIVVIVLAGAVIGFLVSRRGGNETAAEVTTPSGLKITDLRVGDGASPQLGQVVTVHYIGKLENGTEFNNSYKGGKPIDFTLGKVIPGWNEGLATMKVGGKRKLFIPSNLAYGPTGRPPMIPPNSNLIFEIELIKIK